MRETHDTRLRVLWPGTLKLVHVMNKWADYSSVARLEPRVIITPFLVFVFVPFMLPRFFGEHIDVFYQNTRKFYRAL